MNTKSGNSQFLKILYVLSWVAFVGVAIVAGGLILNTIIALVRQEVATPFWRSADLSALFKYDRGHFVVITLIMSIVAVLKACLLFQVVRILSHKNMDAPSFRKATRRALFLSAYWTLLIGLFSGYGINYAAWLAGKGVKMPDTQYLHLGGADVWVFIAVVFFAAGLMLKQRSVQPTVNEVNA